MEQQNREYNDEINLYDLWKVIAKRKKLIIGLFIVIVISTAIVSFLMPDIYRGDAGLLVVLDPEGIVVKEITGKEITGKEITDLIGNVDREKRLSIVPKSYPNVKDLQFKSLKDSKNKIIVTIDAKTIDDIPKALLEAVDYLNNMDIIKSETKREKDILLKKSAELSDIIISSPDLLSAYNRLFRAGKLSTIGFNPVEVSRKISEIKIELISIEQQLSRLNNGGIEIAVKPYVSNTPVSPKRLLIVVVAGIFSLLLGVFLAIFIEYIGNIKNKKS
jgi:hypothetical protein